MKVESQTNYFCDSCKQLLPHHYRWQLNSMIGDFPAECVIGDEYHFCHLICVKDWINKDVKTVIRETKTTKKKK